VTSSPAATTIHSMQSQGHDSTSGSSLDELRPPRPIALVPRPAKVARRLTDRVQWVLWQYEYVDLRWTKVPYQVNGHKASTTRARTWATFSAVWIAYQGGGWDGIGYVLTSADGLVGLDLDHCIVDGVLTPRARAIVDTFGVYAETSPSGTGIRLVCEGSLAKLVGRKSSTWQEECYATGRFLSFTGHLVDDQERPITAQQAALEAWHHEVWPPKPPPSARVAPSPATRLDDQEILAKVRAARNADKFAALFDHAPSESDTRTSEDDLALADILAFYTQDPAQLRRLLEASARRRAKWDTRRGASTWLDVYVIDKALSDLTATYSGGQTWDGPTLTPTEILTADADADTSPAIMARLAWLEAELERERARRAQAEALNSTLLRALANPYLRNEVRLIVAEAMDYAKALRCGRVDSEGLSWLYIGSKEETGLAGQAQMSPRTISRQLHRHAEYEIDGQPLVELHEDEVEGSDGNHRTRYRYKVPFLEQGGTLHELISKIADYEPPGVAEGTRDKPGGDPHARVGHCPDCGAGLEQEITISKRVQRLEHSIITCTGCGTVSDEGEHVTHSETHVERVRHFRLDLPELPRVQVDEPTPAMMAEVLAPSPLPAAVEDEVRATPCPAPASESSGAIMAEVSTAHCERCGKPARPDGEPSCVHGEDAPPPAPLPHGPALPTGCDHWCPGTHQFPVPLPPKYPRCSGCTRTWRPLDEVS
jgi:hypothetical protein